MARCCAHSTCLGSFIRYFQQKHPSGGADYTAADVNGDTGLDASAHTVGLAQNPDYAVPLPKQAGLVYESQLELTGRGQDPAYDVANRASIVEDAAPTYATSMKRGKNKNQQGAAAATPPPTLAPRDSYNHVQMSALVVDARAADYDGASPSVVVTPDYDDATAVNVVLLEQKSISPSYDEAAPTPSPGQATEAEYELGYS